MKGELAQLTKLTIEGDNEQITEKGFDAVWDSYLFKAARSKFIWAFSLH